MANQGPWKGHSKENLEKALEAAWDAAKGDLTPPATLVVDEISFTGENPITEYSVVVRKP